MGPIGVQELLIVTAVALLIFGPRQLPKLGRAAGETIKEFRSVGKALKDTKEELEAEFKKDVKL